MLDATPPPLTKERPPLAWLFSRVRQGYKTSPGLTAFSLYSLITLVITFPLVFQLGTHLRGAAPTSDSYQNIWYMWWYGQALEQGLDPSRTSLMYGLLPDVQVLISSVVNGLLMWPVIKLFGPLAAYNLAVLLSFPLAGYFTFKLAEYLLQTSEILVPPGRRQLAAFAAGFLFTFSTYHFYRLEGHLGLVTVQWLPFYAWRLFRLKDQPGWRNALLAGLGLGLAGLSDLYYLGYFVMPLTVYFALWFGLTERRTFWKWRNLRFYLVALLSGMALITPFYSFFFNLDPDIRQSVGNRSGDVRELSADMLAWVLPDPQNPWLGSLTAPVYRNFKGLFPIEQAVFPGYALLALGPGALLLKALRRRQVYFWLGLAGVAGVLALGPRLHLAGQALPLPLPYDLVFGRLPLLSSFRAPNRLAVLAMTALAITSGYTLAYILEGWQLAARRATLLVAAGLALSLAHTITFSPPLKTTPVTRSVIYTEIAAETQDLRVLELPLSTQTSPLYYQIFHRKPLVGGVATRISNRMTLSWDKATYLGMFNPAESSAVINNGQVLQAPGGPEIFPLDISFREMLAGNKIGFVIVHAGRAAYDWIGVYVAAQLGRPTFQEEVAGETLLAWRLPLKPTPEPDPPVKPGSFRIRLGDGWNAGLGKSETGGLLRLVEQDGGLVVTPGTPGPANLSLRVTPYIRPQVIQIRLNGRAIGQIDGREPWKGRAATFPLNLQAGPNLIELHSAEGCLHPVDYIPDSRDLRCISFAVEAVQISPA